MTVVTNKKTLMELAHDACEACNSIPTAVQYVRKKLLGDKDLLDTLLDPIIRSAALRAIYCCRSQGRQDMKGHPFVDPDQVPDNVCKRGAAVKNAIAGTLARSILDDWKVNGEALGDLTGQELLIAAARERGMKKGHEKNEKFYRALAEGTPDDESVRLHNTGEAVAKLVKRIYRK